MIVIAGIGRLGSGAKPASAERSGAQVDPGNALLWRFNLRRLTAEEVRDFQSREIFVKILDETEEHIDWLETQLDLIQRVGAQNYQQEQMFSGS